MPLSNLTFYGGNIADGSAATTGSVNARFSNLSQDLNQLNEDASNLSDRAVGWNRGSVSTYIDSSSSASFAGNFRSRGTATFDSTVTVTGPLVVQGSVISGGIFSNLSNQWVNVRNYGAVGDGSTDDSTAIQNAINSAVTNSVVLLPFTANNYSISTEIVLRKGVTLMGQTPGLTLSSQGENVIRIEPLIGGQVISVENLRLSGNTNGINISGNTSINQASHFHDIQIANTRNAGIFLDSSSGAAVIGTRWDNIKIETVGHGIYSVGTDKLGSTLWSGLRVASATSTAVHIQEQASGAFTPNVTLLNPIIESNGRHGIEIFGAIVTLIDPHFESNGSNTDDGYADLSVQAGPGSARGIARIFGGFFSNTVGSGQTQRNRIQFRSTFAVAEIFGTHFLSADSIDGRNNTAGSRIWLVGLLTSPTIGRYSLGNILTLDVSRAQVPDLRISVSSPPASGLSSGVTGDVQWDSSFIYLATSTNSWKRATLAAF